jgi:hypothetical protein
MTSALKFEMPARALGIVEPAEAPEHDAEVEAEANAVAPGHDTPVLPTDGP